MEIVSRSIRMWSEKKVVLVGVCTNREEDSSFSKTALLYGSPGSSGFVSRPIRLFWAAWILVLAFSSTTVLALPEGVCTNDAVPPSTPSSDFTVLGGGDVVLHNSTGLEWQRCAVGQSWDGSTCSGTSALFRWNDALEMASSKDGGWRLPNVNELASIVEKCRNDPAINLVVFPNTSSSIFWTSSPAIENMFGAWYVLFSDGRDSFVGKNNSYRVRLVRD